METEAFFLQRNEWVPNNPRLPVIVYRGAVQAGNAERLAVELEGMFTRNGWPAQWRNGVFDYDHYHSTAHEVLGGFAGWARLILGGPGGREVLISAGDALLLPAGTGHRRIEQSSDFAVVGAYPRGQSFDICRAAPSAEALHSIASIPFPASDPVAGIDGPLSISARHRAADEE